MGMKSRYQWRRTQDPLEGQPRDEIQDHKAGPKKLPTELRVIAQTWAIEGRPQVLVREKGSPGQRTAEATRTVPRQKARPRQMPEMRT